MTDYEAFWLNALADSPARDAPGLALRVPVAHEEFSPTPVRPLLATFEVFGAAKDPATGHSSIETRFVLEDQAGRPLAAPPASPLIPSPEGHLQQGAWRAELSVPPSPFYKLPKPFLGEAPRDRVLSHEEIRKVFAAIEREPRITAAWWVMVFLTAARDKSEVMRMEKAEVDRDRNVWIIPREKTKGKRSLVLPLSPWALEVLDAVMPLSGDSALFFPSPKGAGPTSSGPCQRP